MIMRTCHHHASQCPHHCHHDECHHSRHPLRQEGRCPEGRQDTEVCGVQGEVEQDSQVTSDEVDQLDVARGK